MLVSLPTLIIICFITVIIITALTLLAVKWGYAYKHTVDSVSDSPHDQVERGGESK